MILFYHTPTVASIVRKGPGEKSGTLFRTNDGEMLTLYRAGVNPDALTAMSKSRLRNAVCPPKRVGEAFSVAPQGRGPFRQPAWIYDSKIETEYRGLPYSGGEPKSITLHYFP